MPEAVEAVPPAVVSPAAPRLAEPRIADDGCARYADACTGADVRDAELQFRDAYAAAVAAGADPRDLEAVRRRWARSRLLDGPRADLLVTDLARLSGRLGWLAQAADGADERE